MNEIKRLEGDIGKKQNTITKHQNNISDTQAQQKNLEAQLKNLEAERRANEKLIKQKESTKTISGLTKKQDGTINRNQAAIRNAPDGSRIQKMAADYDALINKQKELDKEIRQVNSSMEANKVKISESSTVIDNTTREIEELKLSMKNMVPAEFDQLKQKMSELMGVDYSNLEFTEQSMKELAQAMSTLQTNKMEEVRQSVQALKQPLSDASQKGREFGANMKQSASDLNVLLSKEQQINQFAQQLTYAFSVTAVFQKFKQMISSTINSIKELDAVMAEAAVVTRYSISDMWDSFEHYSEMATQMGVAAKEAYEATTMFYQQGLATKQASDLASESLKLMQIGGVSTEQAVNSLTSALRGFNMELTGISAEHITDVYGELAKISASDIGELSTAMEKTASIANSANMSFESTSTLLSKIIETTREAPETAGTALKTVIARFQELKKAPGEIGTVEGEVVDANKIEGALRTVGVALRDAATGEFRALDDVFFELSAKWDTLDRNTQRYIATVAAGSRQQSRFIAMMQDYDRTLELTNAAQNSAGSSSAQLAKKQESLTFKMQELSNRWEEFMINITDSSLIKGVVDILNGVLKTINAITGVLPDTGTALANVLLLFGGFKMAGKMVTAASEKIVNWGQGLGKKNGEGTTPDPTSQKKTEDTITKNTATGTKNGVEAGANSAWNTLKTKIAEAFRQGAQEGIAKAKGIRSSNVIRGDIANQEKHLADLRMKKNTKRWNTI